MQTPKLAPLSSAQLMAWASYAVATSKAAKKAKKSERVRNAAGQAHFEARAAARALRRGK